MLGQIFGGDGDTKKKNEKKKHVVHVIWAPEFRREKITHDIVAKVSGIRSFGFS